MAVEARDLVAEIKQNGPLCIAFTFYPAVAIFAVW
jgi:hypothetical protein